MYQLCPCCYSCCMVPCHSCCCGSTNCVPAVMAAKADDEYQLLFSFWPALAPALALAGQLGPGPAAPTLYCGWSALLGELLSSSIRDLNYTKSRPILLFPVVSSFIRATMSFGRSHISLSSSPCYLRSQRRAFAQPHNFHCQ